jgi:hypothetical protein
MARKGGRKIEVPEVISLMVISYIYRSKNLDLLKSQKTAKKDLVKLNLENLAFENF